MYVVRPALRAAYTGRPPARFIRGRRYPSTPRPRLFHTLRALAQASDPPSTPDNTPIGKNDAGKPEHDKAAAEEHTDATVATEDAEVLAQKLQRSRETSRRYSAALRRQQRGKKSDGLPPVHIPDWFLKTRVVRHEDQSEATTSAALCVSISHAESGERATCAIPASRDLDAAQEVSRLVRGLWRKRLDDHEKRKVEKYLNDRITTTLNVDFADVTETSSAEAVDTGSAPTSVPSDPTSTKEENLVSDMKRQLEVTLAQLDSADVEGRTARSGAEKAEIDKLSRRLDDLLSDPRLDSQQREDAAQQRTSRTDRWLVKRIEARLKRTANRMSPLALAEIRANMAACLSTPRSSAGDSFSSAKTNLILHSPAAEHEKLMDTCVHEVAAELQADLITLNAQDLGRLAGDYLGEAPEPSLRSIRYLGYDTYRMTNSLQVIMDDMMETADEDSEANPFFPMELAPSGLRAVYLSASRALTNIHNIRSTPFGAAAAFTPHDANNNVIGDETNRAQKQNEQQLEDLKIANLLEALIDANEAKQNRGLLDDGSKKTLDSRQDQTRAVVKEPAFFDYSVSSEGAVLELNSALPASAGVDISMEIRLGSVSQIKYTAVKPKIIYVKDFKELNATHYGSRVVQKLEELVRKRRLSGESIMIIGSTCSRDLTPELTASGVRGLQSEGIASRFRTIVVHPEPSSNKPSLEEAWATSKTEASATRHSGIEKTKISQINIQHLQEMLRSLDLDATASIANMEQGSQAFSRWESVFPDEYTKKVLTYDEVHRIALTALGLRLTDAMHKTGDEENTVSQLSWAHVALAIGLLKASDSGKFAAFDRAAESAKSRVDGFTDNRTEVERDKKRRQSEKNLQRQRELQRITMGATKYEKRLMPGIADPDQIKTTFDQVHVPQETIDSLRTITSLSLLRPDAFNYGILATEKISGALLYGPPGTGKTLLAKAVAKESGSTVLEVSGSQIMDKYVGEGEKNVAAIFSLARKLSPCIVFLDEADAIFSSRDAMRERASHRDILNQFLKEWDGLNDLSVFVMVATNRPFDLDDAVIRRLPRRLLVDLPTQADRKEILRIHLKGEQLDASVELEDLAKRTPFYSGSDLKNIAVSAALACVKEENEHAAIAAAESTSEPEASHSPDPTDTKASPKSVDADEITTESPATSSPSPKVPHLVRGQSYNFPDKRILHARHFDKALQEISASISEDMSSLNAIKKFDEQYGDHKGNKRKKDFGFGVLAQRNENAARVRI